MEFSKINLMEYKKSNLNEMYTLLKNNIDYDNLNKKHYMDMIDLYLLNIGLKNKSSNNYYLIKLYDSKLLGFIIVDNVSLSKSFFVDEKYKSLNLENLLN